MSLLGHFKTTEMEEEAVNNYRSNMQASIPEHCDMQASIPEHTGPVTRRLASPSTLGL